jgi:hypothetical protein
MKQIIRSLLVAAALLFPALAFAQSSPGLVTGQVPTAAQWNSYFAAKQDALGYVPLNTNGGQMLGPLALAPSTSISSSLNLPQGAAPGVPNNGDIWMTSSGLFVHFNDQTVGPLVSSSTAGCALFSSTASGCVASPGAPTGRILSDNGSWINPTSGGTVTSVGFTAGTGLSLSGSTSPIVGSGSFNYSFAPIAADSLWLNGTGASAVPSATAVPNCSILSYSTTSHSFTCGNPGVTSVTAGTGLLGGNIIGVGTIDADIASVSNFLNATSNKILDAQNVWVAAQTVTTNCGCTGFSGTPVISVATPGVVNWTSHGLVANTPVVFSGGTLPTGITAGTVYYVVGSSITTNSFSVSSTPDGSAINTSGTSTGTQTVQSHVLIDFAAGVNFKVQFVSGLPSVFGSPIHATKQGQSGIIYALQPPSGTSVTPSFDPAWKFSNGSVPQFSNVVGRKDWFGYVTESNSSIATNVNVPAVNVNF